MKQTRVIEILLVEDNPGDINLIRKILSKSDLQPRVSVETDGASAIQRLNNLKNNQAPLPDLVLLDLNLPKKDGRTVLKEIKQDEKLRHIPVIILTSSAAQQDVLGSYREHANAYLCKPMSVEEFSAIGKAIEGFWLSCCQLPSTVPGFSV